MPCLIIELTWGRQHRLQRRPSSHSQCQHLVRNAEWDGGSSAMSQRLRIKHICKGRGDAQGHPGSGTGKCSQTSHCTLKLSPYPCMHPGIPEVQPLLLFCLLLQSIPLPLPLALASPSPTHAQPLCQPVKGTQGTHSVYITNTANEHPTMIMLVMM